jgi:hypothetical protein
MNLFLSTLETPRNWKGGLDPLRSSTLLAVVCGSSRRARPASASLQPTKVYVLGAFGVTGVTPGHLLAHVQFYMLGDRGRPLSLECYA